MKGTWGEQRSLHSACSSCSTLQQYTPLEGLMTLVPNRGRSAVRPEWHPSPHYGSRQSQLVYQPLRKSLPDNRILGAYILLLSFGRNVSASLTTGLSFTGIKPLWKPKLACWWATQKCFLSTALPSLGFTISETQNGHGGISDHVVDGSERNIIFL